MPCCPGPPATCSSPGPFAAAPDRPLLLSSPVNHICLGLEGPRPERSLKESALHDPLQVGRYQVIEEVGDGAMGRVWRGFDPELGRPVAIKTVKSEYLTRDTRDEYLHRFRRE